MTQAEFGQFSPDALARTTSGTSFGEEEDDWMFTCHPIKPDSSSREVSGIGAYWPTDPTAIAEMTSGTRGDDEWMFARFGTVLGQQSVAELKDYVAATKYKMKQLGQAYANYSPTWVNQNSAEFTDWTNDWDALQKAVDSALSNANSVIVASMVNLTPSNLIPAQAPFDAIQQAMTKGSPGYTVKGSYQDLYNRIAAKGVNVDYSQMPQPTATDADLKVLKAVPPPPDDRCQIKFGPWCLDTEWKYIKWGGIALLVIVVGGALLAAKTELKIASGGIL